MQRSTTEWKSSFRKPAIYKIRVKGNLGNKMSDRFDMQVDVERPNDSEPVSTLIGKIKDQAALSGILTTLYDLQLTIISVNMLSED